MSHFDAYLVGNKLSPDNLGRCVEGELDGDWGELQLLDGVGLQSVSSNCTLFLRVGIRDVFRGYYT